MPDPKKVLIYSPEFAPMGGIERHLIELTTLLLRNNFIVCLVSTSDSLNSESTEKLSNLGCKIVFMSRKSRSGTTWKKALWLAKTFWNLRKEQWDWIYTNGQGNLFEVAKFARSKQTRMVHQHHTSADEQERPFWGKSYIRYTKNVEVLLAVSNSTRDNISNIIGDREIGIITCLYPWTPIQELSKPQSSPSDSIKLFFAGRLIEEKGVGTILNLSEMDEFSDCEWHIWGSGPHYNEDSFRSYARVYYHGTYNSREEFIDIASKMHGFVLYTRHSEGLPISLMEVTELGIPWVASNRGGCKELALRDPDCQILGRNFTQKDAINATRRLVDAIRTGKTNADDLKCRFSAYYHPQKVRTRWLEFFEGKALTTK